MQPVPHDFAPQDLIAGHPALDFVNTVTARDTTPRDWLDGYGRILQWAGLAGIVGHAAAARLSSMAERAPREAAAALGRARRLREALHDVCFALLARQAPPGDALAELESAWKRAAGRAQLLADAGAVRLHPDAKSSGLDLPLDLVVLA